MDNGKQMVKSDSVVSQLLHYSEQIDGLPEKLLVNNKFVTPGVFIMSGVGMPIALLMGQSESQRLLGRDALPLAILADKESPNGMRVRHGEGSVESLSSSLLILTHSVSVLMEPARRVPKFDYSDLVFNVKEKVLKNTANNDVVDVNDLSIVEHIKHSLAVDKMAMSPKLSRGSYGR